MNELFHPFFICVVFITQHCLVFSFFYFRSIGAGAYIRRHVLEIISGNIHSKMKEKIMKPLYIAVLFLLS